MWRDDAYLLDMLLVARKIVKYSQVLDYERFIKDEMVQDAVMRQIQVIGEAARKISQEFKKAHPDISWPGIIGMRHRVIHEYFRVVPEKVWEAAVQDIPHLIAAIEPLVPPENS